MRAKALGLVDALGGWRVALDAAREAAGLPAGAPVRLATFHPRRRRFGFGLLGGGDGDGASRLLARALAALDPALAGALEAVRAPRGVLSVPPFDLSVGPAAAIRGPTGS
jgi:protease-4